MTSYFDLFDDVSTLYDSETKNTPKIVNKCEHTETSEESGSTICIECGEEIKLKINHEKEWRYYGASESKRSADPTRVQMRKVEEKSITRDVESMGFSDSIVSHADHLYNIVTKGQIYRGNSRKAIIFACVFHAYKMTDKHQTPEKLIKMFGINKKSGLRGLKIVNVNAPKDSDIHKTSITSEHLIYDIMDKFKATHDQKKEVVELYFATKNCSSQLNRARPQSVAAAITYYWITQRKIDIGLKDFAKRVELSEATIQRNTKEIARILA